MEGGIWDSIFTLQGLLLLIAIIVFVAALFMVLRGLIGFIVTSVMLFIAVVAGFLIADNEITQRIFKYEASTLPENHKISVSSIKHSIGEVYELFRTGVCTETVKVVYDPQAIDNLDDVISRLQEQQDQIQAVIKNLRSSTATPRPVLETAESDSSYRTR